MDELDRKLKKTIGFKPNLNHLSPESITYMHSLGERRELSKWLSQACEMMYEYEHHKKGYLIRMIPSDFQLCKHLLRKIGRSLS